MAPYLLRTLGVIMITLQLLPQQGEFVPTLEGGAWVRQSSSLLARVTSGKSPGLSLVLSSLASLASYNTHFSQNSLIELHLKYGFVLL